MSAADYKAKIAAIAKESDSAETGVENGMHAKTTASLVAGLTTFAAAEEKISKEIDNLDPPKNAQAANDELAKGTHDVSVAVEDVLPKLENAATPAAAIAILNKSSSGASAGREVDDAIAQLRKLGYTSGG